MKILKHIVNFTLWSIIALYAFLMLFIHLPASQQYLGERIAAILGEKFDTEVAIGRIDLGFLNRVIIDDIHINDQSKKEMLRVARLSAKIDLLELTQGKVGLSSIQLFGAHARLYKVDAAAKPNFQFLIDSLASKDTTSHTPLDLRINSLIIRRSSVAYDELYKEESPWLLNPHHLHLDNISAQVALKKLTDDSLDINVKRLSLSEHSGLDISKLSLQLQAGRSNASIHNFLLQMPNSKLQADTLTMSYNLKDKQNLLSSLSYKGAFKDSYITPSDLRSLFIPLKNMQRPIYLATDFKGENSILNIRHLNLSSEVKDISIQAKGWLNYAHQHPSWHAELTEVALSENLLDFLQKNISQIPEPIRRIGNLQLTGFVDGAADGHINTEVNMQTGIGSLSLACQMRADKTFNGVIQTPGIHLETLLNDNRLGLLATDVTLSGQLGKEVNAQGLVSRLDYNDYQYSNIGINGSYSGRNIAGYLKVEDPHLAAELEGSVTIAGDNQQEAHQITVKGTIDRIAPHALKLTDQWEHAIVRGKMEADFTAKTINDAQGTLHIRNFNIDDPIEGSYNLDNLLISTGYDESLHYVTLTSDFGKAELRGEFEYNTLAQSIINFVGSALPTLPGLPPITNKTNNNFTMKLQLYKSDWLQKFFSIPVTIRQPLTLSAIVNDHSQTINMEGSLPSFAYNGTSYSDGDIRITTPGDSIKLHLSLTRHQGNGQDMSFRLKGDAADNKLSTSLEWDNHQERNNISGQLNLITSLYQNQSNASEAHVKVEPSHIILNNTTWNVEPSDIIYSTGHLYVDQFMVRNGLQHIIVDGRATTSDRDVLNVDLNEIEVGYILDLVNFDAVEFSGAASGRAAVRALFGDIDGDANLTVDHFKFEKGRMGTLIANVNWNEKAKQIDINALADDGPEAQTLIQGYVSPTYNTIDLNITSKGTYIDFMHNFTSTFLSSITGHAKGSARLAGTLDNINLTGALTVDGEATVTPLNTTYSLHNDTVIFVPDDIQLKNIRVTDKYGNTGLLSGGIHHQHLTNMTFDLYLDAENLLAYDFHDFGESTFYGTVFASGQVDLHGIPGEVTINCNVTPQKNSVFVYNASSPNTISNQEFIEWGSASEDRTKQQVSAPNPSGEHDEQPDIPTDIYLNFLINCTPDATLRLLMDEAASDYINLNGDGTIRATYYNKGPFNMFGTYTVERGTYGITIQNIIKKNFVFNRGGTIVFGGDPYNAALNLQAVYTVNGVSLSDLNIGNSFASNTIRVNCLMNIGGQPSAPQVEFDLEMPTVNADEQQMVRSIINGQQEMNQQVLYLLGIGRFYNQGQNNAGTSQQDQTSLAMQSFLSGTISTQINSLLSTVIKNENWNFGANISTGNEGWHNAEYEGTISGRMLNNRLLLNGQFGYRDNATQATPSFIGDFDIQYLLFPSGNLALKVYNQTNDRYFTKSSLNTQGIGVIMKKDFNGLEDLFPFLKKNRKRKKQPKASK